MKIKIGLGIVLLIFCAFFGCDAFDRPEKDVKLVRAMNKQVAAKLGKEKRLDLIGTGAEMMTDIKMLALSFACYEEVDCVKAKQLLLFAIQEYLSAINGNIELQPYLHNYPFTAANVEINIFFSKPDHSNVASGNISVVGIYDGFVYCKVDNPQGKALQTVSRETYEEALKAHGSS